MPWLYRNSPVFLWFLSGFIFYMQTTDHSLYFHVWREVGFFSWLPRCPSIHHLFRSPFLPSGLRGHLYHIVWISLCVRVCLWISCSVPPDPVHTSINDRGIFWHVWPPARAGLLAASLSLHFLAPAHLIFGMNLSILLSSSLKTVCWYFWDCGKSVN